MQVNQVTDLSQVKDDWYRLFSKQPVSPFLSYPYVQLFAKQFSSPDKVIILKVTDRDVVVAFGAFERIGDTVILLGMKPVLGNEEITDYGDVIVDPDYSADPGKLRAVWDEMVRFLKAQGITGVQLNYIREDSQLIKLKDLYRDISIQTVEVAPWIPLDRSWDEHLTSLSRVDRKELRRKLRRLETQTYQLVELDSIYQEDFDEFVRLHRLSDLAKEKFMSHTMADFFWQVSQLSYSLWKTKLWFLEIGGKRVAAAIGFDSGDSLLMYNSGFDPAYGYYSVGLLIHAFIMQKYMGASYNAYDFLRGAERYKYDLGATNIQLYKIEIHLLS